jgi:hypothetical protein
MNSKLIVRSALALISFTLVVPSAAAAQAGDSDSALLFACNPQPLGPPGQGVVGAIKNLGNVVIFGACVLVATTVNGICIFLTGNPCAE